VSVLNIKTAAAVHNM